MYKSPNDRTTTAFDEIWTMVPSLGPEAATSNTKTIMQDGNVGYDWGL